MADEDTKTETPSFGTSEDIVTEGGDLEGGEGLRDNYALEDNKIDDYYAVGQEYRQYANPQDEPRWSDDEKKFFDIAKGKQPEKKEVKKEGAHAATPSAPATPVAPPVAPAK